MHWQDVVDDVIDAHYSLWGMASHKHPVAEQLINVLRENMCRPQNIENSDLDILIFRNSLQK